MNIVKFCEFYRTPQQFHIVQELLAGDSLSSFVEDNVKIDQQLCRQLFFQICLAVNFMHHNKIAHRDLKLENILFSDKSCSKVKIIDFGLGKNNFEDQMESINGSPYYVAPEIIQGYKYNQKCDIWSLGVCLYKMLTGFYPFNEEKTYKLLQIIQRGSFDLDNQDLSLDAKSLLKGLL